MEIKEKSHVQGIPLTDLDPRGYQELKERIKSEMHEILFDAGDTGISGEKKRRFEELEDDLITLERWANKPARKVPEPFPGGGVGDEVRFLRPEEKLSSIVSPSLEGDYSLGKFLRGLVTGDWKGAVPERRALEITDPTLGGYLVPHPLAARIIDLARNRSVCVQAGALTIPMESNTLDVAVIDEGPVAYWRPEGTAITESNMAFSLKTFTAKTLAALVRCSVELFEDAQNLDSVVSTSLAQALALELDRAALFGAGSNSEPLGLYNTTGVHKVDMGTNGGALEGYAPFVAAIQRVMEANGPDPRDMCLVLSPREYAKLNMLLDKNNNPLQAPQAFQEIRRKLVSNQIPTDLTKGSSENASVAIIGDFSQLWIGMRTNLVLEVSREAGDAFSKMQVLIRAYMRADILVARPGFFAVVDGIIPA
jgi:HK97 family phage major capsid protein